MADIFGSDFSEELYGTGGEDRLYGLGGNDYLDGESGFDRLYGGLGDDLYILESTSARYFSGQFIGFFYDSIIELEGEGTDTLYVYALGDQRLGFGVYDYTLPDTIENGYIQDESILADPVDFDITGNASANRLAGNSGANILNGVGGNDLLIGNGGRDTLVGGVGDDIYHLSDRNVVLFDGIPVDYRYDSVVEQAGEGIDTVEVVARDNPITAFGTDGYTLGTAVENGLILGELAFDLTGNELDNTLRGSGAANNLSGANGDDRLAGGGAFDTLAGGAQDDTYVLDDLSVLRLSNIPIAYRYDAVVETAGGGTDLVLVRALDNPLTFFTIDSYTLGSGVENGRITGSLAFDLLGNGLSNDLTGNNAANLLGGGMQSDILRGLGGTDNLLGGSGNDILIGGAGADSFRFHTRLNAADNVDRIADFVAADDTILLASRIFSGISPEGPLAAAAFRLGTAAADASDRIIYNSANGAIFYDRDGAGGAAQILFARVDPGTSLSAADFALFGG